MTRELPCRPRLAVYTSQARDLVKAFKTGKPGSLELARRFHPRAPGRPDTNDRNPITAAQLQQIGLDQEDAKFIVARSHQFASWDALQRHLAALNKPGSAVARFEAAVNAIIEGDSRALKKLLARNPDLIRARSSRIHRATLLHYTGANGVEGYRQKTPRNIVQIARMLLETGAEVDADFDYFELVGVYPERAGSTTLGLAATSCHPAEAGVQIKLLDLLLDYGASPDGLRKGWNPLVAALHNGRGEAAAHLAKRGAKLDLEGALGVGDVAAARKLAKRGTRKQLEAGFMWACQYGHLAAVEFALGSGARIDARPHGETALHWAAFAGHAQIARALLRRDPPLETKDTTFGGTPLGWALHGWASRGAKRNSPFHEVVEELRSAGAKVDRAWLAPSDRGFPIWKSIVADRRMRAALSAA